MAVIEGKRLEEILHQLGLHEGKVGKGKVAEKAVNKIKKKCAADVKTLDASGGKIPDKLKSKKGELYKAVFMWSVARNGERQIDYVIDNHKWGRYSRKCDDNVAAVKSTMQTMVDAIDMLDEKQRGYFEKDAQDFADKYKKEKGTTAKKMMAKKKRR